MTGKAPVTQSQFRPRFTTIHPGLSQMVKSGCVGMEKKRKSSINTVSHDAHTVSARFIYGSSTTHNGSATIHHGGATNAHDASTIRYGASTIQAERYRSVTTSHECAQLSGCHATVCQILTPNIIISPTLDEVSHALKKKSCRKIKAVTGPTG